MRRLAAHPDLLRLRGHAPAEGAAEGRPSAAESARSGSGSSMLYVLAGCLGLSALTLIFPSTPTYDPWAWIMWGREITQFDLVTEGGPSWKPLPVLFTAPFSLLGADVAPYLWLWIARAGALLALAMAFRLARRLVGEGPMGIVAGLGAAAFLATTYEFVRDAALGNSEALLAALVLWAIERHLDGRRDHALYLAFAAALLRPEVWPFLGIYGLWLWFADPRLRLRLVLLAVAIPVLWLGPELWGSGNALRASDRANNPNPGSAAFAAHPGLEVFDRFERRTLWPLEVTSLIAAVLAAVAWWRHRAQGAILFLAAAGLSWSLLVAAMTEGGYAGNQRYMIVTTATLCVLGGIGGARILQGVQALVTRLTGSAKAALAVTALVLAGGVIVASPVTTPRIEKALDELRYEASLWHTLDDVIERAGGADRLLSCGGVYSGPFQTQMIAYQLGVHGIDVSSLHGTPAPGVTFRTRTVPNGPLVARIEDDRFRQVAASGRWSIWTAPRDDARGRDCPSTAGAPRAPAQPTTPVLTSSR